MRMILTVFAIIWFGISCSDENRVPANIIAQDKMVKILLDLVVADQYSNQYLKKDTTKTNVKLETMKMFDEIFMIHHVTREDFNMSYQYYVAHPDLSKPIFDSLAATANRQRRGFYQHPINPAQPKAHPVQGR